MDIVRGTSAPGRRWFGLSVAVLAVVVGIAFWATQGGGQGGGAVGATSLAVPRTAVFPDALSELGLYDDRDALAELTPASDHHRYELSSTLYSDHSEKDRLLSIPAGTVIEGTGDGMPRFPEGTTLVKTFAYPLDATDPAAGRRIIETRVLLLVGGEWNVATYVWNDAQTEALLELDGVSTTVTWLDESGRERTIDYEVPDEMTCVACHQQQGAITPLGPELRYLNFDVDRSGELVNQLAHLDGLGLFDQVDPAAVAQGVDYLDAAVPLSDRGRAYLDMNCAHCHNPGGWERPAGEGLDLRAEIDLASSGILTRANAIGRNMANGEMPFFGTTTIDPEGLELVMAYLDELGATADR